MKDRHEYEGDVVYEVWRSGGNPDALHPDSVDDSYWSGESPETCAHRELQRQQYARERPYDHLREYYDDAAKEVSDE